MLFRSNGNVKPAELAKLLKTYLALGATAKQTKKGEKIFATDGKSSFSFHRVHKKNVDLAIIDEFEKQIESEMHNI